jgi:hypothetical protein
MYVPVWLKLLGVTSVSHFNEKVTTVGGVTGGCVHFFIPCKLNAIIKKIFKNI